jgi:hypothetical protein
MSEKIKGWKYSETIGVGIINPIAINRMMTKRLKGWARLYSEILKYGMAVDVISAQENGSYIIETKKAGSSYWYTRHVLEPGKEVIQDE